MTWVALAAQTTGTGLIVLAVLTALLTRYRQWRAPEPAPACDVMAVADAVREPPAWHRHGCGCWCGPSGQGLVCPMHALEAQEIRDMLRLEAWERERHEP